VQWGGGSDKYHVGIIFKIHEALKYRHIAYTFSVYTKTNKRRSNRMIKTERKPNRLIDVKSPYLLQHAYNPVDWYPWGDEAFEKAKREDKPVFLSIGYST
jgi:hypothetical protein